MENQSQHRRITATFEDVRSADLALDAVRKAGFSIVDRPTDRSVVVDPGEHAQHAGELEGMLGAYGAREFIRGRHASSADASPADEAGPGAPVRTAHEERIELVEEDLRARTRPVETGEVTIRRNVIEETRTIEVPVRREELIVEQHPIQRRPVDSLNSPPPITDPLIQQLMDRLHNMQPGESLRIPIVQDEVVVYKRPVVVEEITVGKRLVEETTQVSDMVRREEARIEPHGDISVHDSKQRRS